MPHPLHSILRPLSVLLLLAGAWAGVPAAEPSAPSAPSKVESTSAPAPSASAAPPLKRSAGNAPLAIGPRDPMDMLRERLAQKLGTVKTPDGSNPNVVRVVTKGTDAPALEGDPVRFPRRTAAAPRRAPAGREAAAAEARSPNWDYSGSGSPAEWARLNPDFSKCSTGARQSPIDIRDGLKVELDPVRFHYQPSGFKVIDNGHTVQVNVAPGNTIEVLGRRYELVQFHFHRPSEERIDGKQFDMVVHLVHRDDQGRLAVVAVLLEKGSAQGVVQAVWNNLPLEKGEELAAPGTVDLNQLLPSQQGYFTYMGSLTEPPCSEGVLWMVMKQPVSVSPEQIGIFARLYPMNARPVQPPGGRLIKESN